MWRRNKAAFKLVNVMSGFMETASAGEGAALVANRVMLSVSLLVVVIVLLISPFRGAAMEPAR